MSDPRTVSPSPEPEPAEATDAAQAEDRRGHAYETARVEMYAQAVKGGFTVPDAYADYLDFSKLVCEDGTPSAEAIAQVLHPFRPKEPVFAQRLGMGRQGDGRAFPARHVPLDVRHR
ncbi:hypothetical protein ACH427_24560 [Streptomyces sp. NPDC020379]|uniref:hypothetical protein n=1 Tax=Streptomyces sp. NPDC020379 TaxID=3365071 RepID=UPI0037A139D5